jgi:hypothetical protein
MYNYSVDICNILHVEADELLQLSVREKSHDDGVCASRSVRSRVRRPTYDLLTISTIRYFSRKKDQEGH